MHVVVLEEGGGVCTQDLMYVHMVA